MLLRIEDIDRTRCRPEFTQAILEDLAWLGLDWPGPVRVQSQHLAEHAAALARLDAQGLLYPCFCTRADLREAASAPHGPAALYPGTCRGLSPAERKARIAEGLPHALRLDTGAAIGRTGPLAWHELGEGMIPATPERLGDVVLARKDIGTSYHLAVTWDDAVQAVGLVTRGRDLYEATHIHRLLQALLDLPVPVWRHHDLLLDEGGRRLAKREGAAGLRQLRESGMSPAEARALAGFPD